MLNFVVLDMLQHIGKLGPVHAIELSNLDFKMGVLLFSGIGHFGLPLHLSLQNVCKGQYI